MSPVGIVTVTYNGETVLPDFVRCLKAQTFQDFILYIVDNQSGDKSADVVERLCQEQGIRYRLLRNNTNFGIACGNNQGIRMALADGCDPLFIANNDIEFSDDTFAELLRLTSERSGDLIAPKVVFHGPDNLTWYAGGRISWWRGVPRTRGYLKPDSKRYAKPEYTGYASTCFLVVPSNVFREIGLMDEDYFVYVDDSDFIVRAIRAGHRIFYTPEPTIQHKVSVSTGGADSPFTIYQISKNTMLFLHKNNPPPIAAWYMCLFWLRSSLHLLRYRGSQRTKLFEGLRDGFRFVLRQPVDKHNIPPV